MRHFNLGKIIFWEPFLVTFTKPCVQMFLSNKWKQNWSALSKRSRERVTVFCKIIHTKPVSFSLDTSSHYCNIMFDKKISPPMISSLSLKQFPLLYVQLCIFCSTDILLQTALRIRVGMKQQTWAVTQNSYKTITQAALERKRKIHIKSIRGDFGQQEWKTSSCGWVWDAYQSLVQHNAFTWHALWFTYETGKAAGRARESQQSMPAVWAMLINTTRWFWLFDPVIVFFEGK